MKRKSKTTLAEKISAHVEGDTQFERFENLVRRLIDQPVLKSRSKDSPEKKKFKRDT